MRNSSKFTGPDSAADGTEEEEEEEAGVTALAITRAGVIWLDARPVGYVKWSGRMMKVENLRGKGLGRLLPAGYHEGRPDDGRGLYDLWTALHPHVPVPSDKILARDLPVEECVALLIEGALSAAACLLRGESSRPCCMNTGFLDNLIADNAPQEGNPR